MTTASTATIVSLAGLALLNACGKESTAPHSIAASIEVTPATAGVVIGQTVQLTARVKDAAGHELAGLLVTWTSNAQTQGPVSPTGLVTGVALSDTVVITATSEGKSASATLAVVMDLTGEWNFTEQLTGRHQQRAMTCSDTGSYVFTQSGADVDGASAQIGTCVGPLTARDNTQWPTPIATGRLSSTRVSFRVEPDCRYEGDVTGPPAARLSGTVTCADFQDTTAGTWEAVPGGAPVAAVTVRWDVQTVVGGVVQLIAVPRDAAGHVLSRALAWSSDNPSVATVSDGGLVAARTPGSARIAATSEGKSGTAAVTADLISFSSISAGLYHSCAVTPAGAAYCWGWGGDGQLGTGFRTPLRVTRSSLQTPLAVMGGRTFATIAAGSGRSCGVTTSGEALCWGENSSGQLGDGSRTSSLVPVSVTGGLQFASLTLGAYHACGVTTTNAAYCWGVNSNSQLGDGSRTFSPSPVLVAGDLLFQSVRAGLFHTCGITIAQVGYCWGYNLDGQVGDGTSAFAVATPVAIAGDHNFASVAAGWAHSCAMTPEGAAYCWGLSDLLGGGSGPDQLIPVTVAGGLSYATAGGAMSAGQEGSCGLTRAGAAYCWGHNDLGELGDGSTTRRSTPVPVSGELSFAMISVGTFHTCGVTTAAVAFCWGSNTSGQLGATTAQSCSYSGAAVPCARTPIQVAGTVQPGATARVAGHEFHVPERDGWALPQRLGPDFPKPASIVLAPRE